MPIRTAGRNPRCSRSAFLLKGAIQAEGKVGLKMNIRKANLKKIISLLPALKNPTISSLSQEGWLAVETIIEERSCVISSPSLKKPARRGLLNIR